MFYSVETCVCPIKFEHLFELVLQIWSLKSFATFSCIESLTVVHFGKWSRLTCFFACVCFIAPILPSNLLSYITILLVICQIVYSFANNSLFKQFKLPKQHASQTCTRSSIKIYFRCNWVDWMQLSKNNMKDL